MNHYDVFLSHANADKIEYVEDLKKSFDKLGIKIFYDKDSLKWGDDWKKKIIEGLNNCDFGVIVFSDSFFGREWTEKELKTLLSRQNKSGQKIILPILYNINCDDLKKHYRKLADIQFLESSKNDIKDITIQLAYILLSENKQKQQEITQHDRFDRLFSKMNTLKFYKWFECLIMNGNTPIKDYDDSFIGWQNEFSDLLQYEENEMTGDLMFRINPIHYEEAINYYEKIIKPQI